MASDNGYRANATDYSKARDTVEPEGLSCPHCGHDKLRTLDTRRGINSINRRRACGSCDYRFKTVEVVVEAAD